MWMYPLIVLLGYGIYKKSNEIFQAGIIFSLIGASIALFHYAGHIQAFFIDEKQQSFLPCSEVGLIPSCTQTYVISFGFVTIPLMAAIAFWVIAFLLYKSQKIHHS
jgi:disulfide bond formation protein DsbB